MNGFQISDVALNPDGEALSLILKNEKGGTLPLSFQPSELQKFVDIMIGIAVEASKQRTNLQRVPISQSAPTVFRPSELTDIAIVQTETQKFLLLVRMFDVDLTFEVTPPALRALAERLGQAVLALGADETKPH